MLNFNIHVTTPQESDYVQVTLFKMGKNWGQNDSQVRYSQQAPLILTVQDLDICCSTCPNGIDECLKRMSDPYCDFHFITIPQLENLLEAYFESKTIERKKQLTLIRI